MPSIQAYISNYFSKKLIKPKLADFTNLDKIREIFNNPLPYPNGCNFESFSIDNVSGEWITSHNTSNGIMLYIHGGGFVGGSSKKYRPITTGFALQGWKVLAIDYRLAPEHPFPAALDDVSLVYKYIVENYSDQRIVVAGDSAGGNLTLSLIHLMKAQSITLPDCCALISPSTDMAGNSESLIANADKDCLFDGRYLKNLSHYYVQDNDRNDPLLSPINADFKGFPPMIIHVGRDETLLDDSVRLFKKARAEDVNVSLQIYPKVPHVWQMIYQMPEAHQSIQILSNFLLHSKHLSEDNFEFVDFLIIGAGISGIGMAVNLQQHCYSQSMAILDARSNLGGTWDHFKYPGIRADSDRFLMGFPFKPFLSSMSRVSGPEILKYLDDTAKEFYIDQYIRLDHKVLKANWSTESKNWIVEIATPNGIKIISCRILLSCSGYYDYAKGHNPKFNQEKDFKGIIVHTHNWPENLDYNNKNVLVIGSGATAVTVAPALAKSAKKVFLVQRSPSYIVSVPEMDTQVTKLSKLLPLNLVYKIMRVKYLISIILFYKICRSFPEKIAHLISWGAATRSGSPEHLKHFTPNYKPWDQRVCFVPDGDLFKHVYDESIEIHTDQIRTIKEDGVELESGKFLSVDIIVKATGLNLKSFGGVRFTIDQEPIDFTNKFLYKGCMLNDFPNVILVKGFGNIHWTLCSDLTAKFTNRMILYMLKNNLSSFNVIAPINLTPTSKSLLNSNYVIRGINHLPNQSTHWPWKIFEHSWIKHYIYMKFTRIKDKFIHFD